MFQLVIAVKVHFYIKRQSDKDVKLVLICKIVVEVEFLYIVFFDIEYFSQQVVNLL